MEGGNGGGRERMERVREGRREGMGQEGYRGRV